MGKCIMKNFNILIFVLLLWTSHSCMDYSDRRALDIENKSSSPIYCFYSMDDHFKKVDHRHIKRGLFDAFKINSTDYMLVRPRHGWNFERDSEDNHIRIFIVSQDLVDSLGWKKIVKENIYSKVYKLNVDSIEAQKWKIVYE